MLTRNFSAEEFECKCCGKNEVSYELVKRLQWLRDRFGKPLVITSGYRCDSHNKNVGGKRNSKHALGLAADVLTVNMTSSELHTFLKLIFEFDFRGVGIASTFIHLDIRDGDEKLWTY
jgi:uncharacterized protein YcbK (DUF882 family)